MISVQNIVDKLNQKISNGNLTNEEISQIHAANQFLSSNNTNFQVQSIGNLPDGPSNKGRLIYVIDEDDFYYYDDLSLEWSNNFTSSPRTSGLVFGFGENFWGQVGVNVAPTDQGSPVTVVGGITNWSQLEAGSTSSIGLTDTGEIYAWGRGFGGPLGTNDAIDRSSPVTVVGGITNWSAISHSTQHSLAITDTGDLYAWGDQRFDGKLGTDEIISRSSPVTVVGGITSWNSAAAGSDHSLGLTSTGVLYAWGRNNRGQLGTDDVVDRSSPVTVVGGITSWNKISAGREFTLGVTDTGVLYAWGRNQFSGRLGTNDEDNRSSPVTVVGGITNWSSSISAGELHSLGITDTGVLYAWGDNDNWGQLGHNDTISRSSPVTVVGGITNWSQVEAGGNHSVGLTDTGILYAWGRNNNLNLAQGSGDTENKSSPVTVIGGITNWSQISAGSLGSHTLAILEISKGFN